MSNITAKVCAELQNEVDAAIKNFFKSRGMEVRVGNNARYSPETGEVNLSLRVRSQESSDLVSKWNKLAPMLGLKNEWFQKHVRATDGRLYALIDIDMRKSKYPVIGECEGGGRVRFSVDKIVATLAA